MSDSEISNKSKDATECMEKIDLDNEIYHCEQKLKHIEGEYSKSMIKDWPKIREKELFFHKRDHKAEKIKTRKEPSYQ